MNGDWWDDGDDGGDGDVIKSSAKHCVMFSFFVFIFRIDHIEAMSGVNYCGVQH